jgi:hypothetical protein
MPPLPTLRRVAPARRAVCRTRGSTVRRVGVGASRRRYGRVRRRLSHCREGHVERPAAHDEKAEHSSSQDHANQRHDDEANRHEPVRAPLDGVSRPRSQGRSSPRTRRRRAPRRAWRSSSRCKPAARSASGSPRRHTGCGWSPPRPGPGAARPGRPVRALPLDTAPTPLRRRMDARRGPGRTSGSGAETARVRRPPRHPRRFRARRLHPGPSRSPTATTQCRSPSHRGGVSPPSVAYHASAPSDHTSLVGIRRLSESDLRRGEPGRAPGPCRPPVLGEPGRRQVGEHRSADRV